MSGSRLLSLAPPEPAGSAGPLAERTGRRRWRVRREPAAGPPARTRARRTGATRERGPEVLRLAADLSPGRGAAVTGAVLRRVAGWGAGAGTVVLDLAAAADVGPGEHAELIRLRDSLRARGTALRLVAAGREARQLLAGGGAGDPLEVHPTLRSAVLASCAELPGAGLVVGAIRDALAVPAEPLGTGRGDLAAAVIGQPASPPAAARPGPRGFAHHGWGEPEPAVGGLAVS